jgi:hypothetical protein
MPKAALPKLLRVGRLNIAATLFGSGTESVTDEPFYIVFVVALLPSKPARIGRKAILFFWHSTAFLLHEDARTG